MRKAAKDLKQGDHFQLSNGDLLQPLKEFPSTYPLACTVLKASNTGMGRQFKTVNGWTRTFNPTKLFVIEERLESRITSAPLQPQARATQINGISID